MCYINIGTYEPWRLDEDQFLEAGLGAELPYSTERWIDINYKAGGREHVRCAIVAVANRSNANGLRA